MNERKGEFVLYSEISYYQDKIKQIKAENGILRNSIETFLDRWNRSGPDGSAQWEKFDFAIDLLKQVLKENKDE